MHCNPDLSAVVSYKSMNGDFYTDFEIEKISSKIEKNNEKSKTGTIYRINNIPRIKIGEGGFQMNFETINGDMTIKKQ